MGDTATMPCKTTDGHVCFLKKPVKLFAVLSAVKGYVVL